MTGTIGTLNVDMNLNSAAFIEAMRATATAVTTASAEMTAGLAKVSTGFDSLIAGGQALIAALGVERMISFAQSSIEAAANIARLAETVGLTSDQFQKFQIAAEQVGIDQERFNIGVQRFASNLGAAKEGTGSLFQALSVMNPELLTSVLHAGSMNDALLLVFHAMGNMTDAAERARIAQSSFGRGMQQTALIAEALASDLSDKIKMDPDVIKGSQLLYENLKLAETAIQNGFTTGLVAAFAGDLKLGDGELVKMNQNAAQFGYTIGSALEVAITGTKYLISEWGNLETKLTTLGNNSYSQEGPLGLIEDFLNYFSGWDAAHDPAKKLEDTSKAAQDFAQAMANLHQALAGTPIIPTLDDLQLKTAEWAGDLSRSNSQLRTLIASVGQGPVALAQMKNGFDALNEVIKKHIDLSSADGKNVLALATSDRNLQQVLGYVSQAYAQTESPLQKYRDELAKINLLTKEGGQAAEIASQMHVQAAAAMAVAYAEPIASIAASFGELFSKNKAFAISSAVISAAVGIAKAFELPFPLNWEQAAAVAAACAVQIQRIQSTTMGSGGGVTSPSAKGASSGKSGGGGGGGGTTMQQAISINLIGDTYGRAQIETLVGHLKLYQKDGGTILIT